MALLFIFLIPIAALVLLAALFKKIIASVHRRALLAACLAGMAAIVAWGYDAQARFTLSVVPDALGVSSMSYTSEQTFGLGPGGNETGLRLYPLDATISGQIAAQGMSFLETMPPNADQGGRSWRGVYEQWQPTPIVASIPSGTEGGEAPFSLEAYHDRYGFAIAIDPDVSATVNRIVQSPGAFYAYGRIGIIVVSPRERLVVYMYSG